MHGSARGGRADFLRAPGRGRFSRCTSALAALPRRKLGRIILRRAGCEQCFLAVCPSTPCSRGCLRHASRLEAWTPSHRKSAPISPSSVQASAARTMRALSAALELRRVLRGETFPFGPVPLRGAPSLQSWPPQRGTGRSRPNSLVTKQLPSALYTKMGGQICLRDVGKEGGLPVGSGLLRGRARPLRQALDVRGKPAHPPDHALARGHSRQRVLCRTSIWPRRWSSSPGPRPGSLCRGSVWCPCCGASHPRTSARPFTTATASTPLLTACSLTGASARSASRGSNTR